jgi:putative transposase
VKPADKRAAVDYARGEHGLSRAQACGLFGLSRSTYYYRGQERSDTALLGALREAAAKRRRWGYRRLGVVLRRQGFRDNHKRIWRVYREAGLQVPKRKKRKTSKWRGEKPVAPERANQRWSMDFVQDTTARGQRLRFFNVVDDFTRECLWIEVDSSLTGARVTRVLDQIAHRRGRPESILMDNGPEFTSQALDLWAYNRRIGLQFIEPGKPMQNPYVESFNGKFRDECLNEHWFLNLAEAREISEAFRIDYNEQRPHSALNNWTPAAFANSLLSALPPRGEQGQATTFPKTKSQTRSNPVTDSH